MRPLHHGQNPVPEGKLEIRHQLPVSDSATFTTPEASEEDLGDLLLEVLPPDGSTMGNLSAREALSRAAERPISEADYEAVRDKALALGLIRKVGGVEDPLPWQRASRVVVATRHLLLPPPPATVGAEQRRKHPPTISRRCSGQRQTNSVPRWMRRNTSIWCWV